MSVAVSGMGNWLRLDEGVATVGELREDEGAEDSRALEEAAPVTGT